MTDIRIRQLVVPSGVGALVNDTSARSLLVRSLDAWFTEANEPAEFDVSDARLRELLGVSCLRSPPEWRSQAAAYASPIVDPNLRIAIPSFRFPSWWTCRAAACHWMTQSPRGMSRAPVCERTECKLYKKPMVQVPLVLACEHGCLSDRFLLSLCCALQRYAFLRAAFLPCATIRFPTDSGGHATTKSIS
jgi:hypothetical protein